MECKNTEQTTIPQTISHHFSDGLYMKEVFIPDGCKIVSHKHTFNHLSILAQGCVIVDVDGARTTHYAPEIIEIVKGENHEIEAVNGDVIWICAHHTHETDVTKVDDVLIQKKTVTSNMHDTGLITDVSELNKALENNPQLWNQYTLRTESPDSPHYGCDDIWVRFNDWKNYDPNNPQAFHDEHESVWYQNKIAVKVAEMVLGLTPNFGNYKTGVQLGGVLITRIPAGGKVLRHNDAGRWHAEFYKDKYLIPLKCDDKQAFCFDGERHVTEVGHVYKFNNLEDHWVDNDSDQERISLIICMRHD